MRRYRYLSGLIGCCIVIIGAIISSIPYVGESGQNYSMINFFISELGDLEKSTLCLPFNLGLIVGSSFLVYFSISTGKYIGFRKGWAIGILGSFSCICCGLVGLIPQNFFVPHVTVALGFFGSALIIVLITAGLTIANRIEFPKWTLVPDALVIVCFSAFLLSPSPIFMAWMESPDTWVRPEFWPKAIMEWSCFLSMNLWIMILSIYLYRNQHSANEAI